VASNKNEIGMNRIFKRFSIGLGVVLGLSTAPRPDLGFPGAWYDLGDGQLHLIQHQQKTFDGIDPTAPHFAVEVASLAGFIPRCLGRRIGFQRMPANGNKYQLYIHDADRFIQKHKSIRLKRFSLSSQLKDTTTAIDPSNWLTSLERSSWKSPRGDATGSMPAMRISYPR